MQNRFKIVFKTEKKNRFKIALHCNKIRENRYKIDEKLPPNSFNIV